MIRNINEFLCGINDIKFHTTKGNPFNSWPKSITVTQRQCFQQHSFYSGLCIFWHFLLISFHAAPRGEALNGLISDDRVYKNDIKLEMTSKHAYNWKIFDGWQGTIYCNINLNLGIYSLSGRASYSEITWSLEAARLDVGMIVSLWKLTGIWAALLPRCLSNFRKSLNLPASRLQEILQ